MVFKATYQANLSTRSSLCCSSPENRKESSFVSVCGRSAICWGWFSLFGFHSYFNLTSSLTICPTISGQELMLAVSGLISRGEGLLSGWKGDGLLGDGDLSSPGLGESLELPKSPAGATSGSCTVHRTCERKAALPSPTCGWQRWQPTLVVLVWCKSQTSLCILVRGQLWLFLSHRLLLCLWPLNRSPVVESRD